MFRQFLGFGYEIGDLNVGFTLKMGNFFCCWLEFVGIWLNLWSFERWNGFDRFDFHWKCRFSINFLIKPHGILTWNRRNARSWGFSTFFLTSFRFWRWLRRLKCWFFIENEIFFFVFDWNPWEFERIYEVFNVEIDLTGLVSLEMSIFYRFSPSIWQNLDVIGHFERFSGQFCRVFHWKLTISPFSIGIQEKFD